MSEQIERRHMPFEDVELREEGQGPGTLVGYSAVFDSETEIAGMFREKIKPGAFAEAIEDGDVRALFNHNPDHILGRQSSGTLRLKEDERGLRSEIELPDTATGRDVATSVKRGDLTGQSFGFRVAEQTWEEKENELDLRTIEKFALVRDVGPVTYPAYEDTDVGVARSEYRSWKEAQKQPDGVEPEPKPEPEKDSEQDERNADAKIARLRAMEAEAMDIAARGM